MLLAMTKPAQTMVQTSKTVRASTAAAWHQQLTLIASVTLPIDSFQMVARQPNSPQLIAYWAADCHQSAVWHQLGSPGCQRG